MEQQAIDDVREWLAEARHIPVPSGAGMSAESGIAATLLPRLLAATPGA